MAVCGITVIPIGTSSPSASSYIAKVVSIIKESGFKSMPTPIGTAIEGDLEEILKLIPKLRDAIYAEGLNRVVMNVYIDERNDKELTLKGKMVSLDSKLGGKK